MKNKTILNTETKDEMEGGACEKIFTAHNGKIIEEELNEFTHNNFVLQEQEDFDNFAYINSEGDIVVIYFNGEIVTNMYLPAIFENRTKKRLLRTNEMFLQWSKIKQAN